MDETPDPAFWRETRRERRRPREPLRASANAVVALLAVGTVAALYVLWPHGTLPGTPSSTRTEGAVVDSAAPAKCPGPGETGCTRVSFRLTSGTRAGSHGSFTVVGSQGLALSRGDRIRVYANEFPKGASAAQERRIGFWSFADFDRRSALLWLAGGFVVLLLLTARLRGLRALLGLAASLVAVVEFVAPAILHGGNPVEVAVVGSFAVLLLTMPLTYGLGPKMLAALLGTGASLLVAAGLADLAAQIAHLSGASEEALYLVSTQSALSLRGLLVAGMVIGALGVLVDLTVSQAATVLALRRANPSLGFGGLFRGAIDVGHDHIAATVNTLVFAYAGAALPTLLIFTVGHTSFTEAVNGEAVAGEIVAALVGSIGLILSMPLTTALAALLATRMDADELAGAGEHVHAH
jgi:uncharacterized membrane protein